MNAKIIHVRPHIRKAPVDKDAPKRAFVNENLLGFVTHRQCLEALDRALSEPLDRPEFADMPEEQRARIRESF